MNSLQNETGPIKIYPIEITKYSRDDFLRYQEDSYDSDNPTQYNYAMLLIAEKHKNKEMQQLTSTTANGGATNTANSSGGGSSGVTSGGGGVIPPVDPYKADMKALNKAGIPDWKAFALLNHDDEYATWWKKFLNTATLQGFEKLLDPSYVPSTAEEKKVFDLRQRHLYSILTKILLTSKGIDLLRDHVSDTDAQKVLSELKKHQTDSVIASRRGRECLQEILHARIDPNRNREDQIVAFKELLRTYDSYLKKHMDEATKLTYVETFCSSAPGLSNIPNLTAIIQKATGVSLSTAQQMDIVESQALMDDNNALLPRSGGRTREHRSAHRSVNLTNLNPFPTDEYNPFQGPPTRDRGRIFTRDISMGHY